jgi:hypothetical protein
MNINLLREYVSWYEERRSYDRDKYKFRAFMRAILPFAKDIP